MTEHRQILYGQRIPQSFLDAFQQLLGVYVSPNFKLSMASPTTLQVVAGADNDQVTISINGRWRFNTATVNAAHPGGSAGSYDVYVTGSDNVFVAGSPETDNTVYAFGLAIRPTGSPPATALYRKVATIDWDGTAIKAIHPLAMLLLPDGSVTTAMLLDGAVTGAKILDGTVNTAELADGAVTSAKIADGTIVGADVADGTLGIAKLPQSVWTTVHGVGTLAARPPVAAGNAGYLYLATDVNGGTVYRSDGAAWTQHAAGVAHASLHAPGGADALPWTTVHGYGTLASRPAAASTNAGYLYYATDTQTTYRSNGSSWDSETVPLPSNTGIAGSILLWGTAGARPAASGSNANFFYFATDTGSLYQNQSSAWVLVSAAGRMFSQVVGNGTATSIAVAHNLGTTDVVVRVREVASPFSVVYPEIQLTDGNTATLIFDSAPAVGAYQVLVIGVSSVATIGAHAGSHAPGGSDPINYTLVNLVGVAGSRPAAAASNAGLRYFATDTGEWSQSNGTTWTQLVRPLLTLAQFNALTPYDGMEVFVQLDAANSVNAHIRYNAGSSNTHKWERLSATSARSYVNAQETVAGSTADNYAYQDAATIGPTYTLPRNGVYRARWAAIIGATGRSGGAGGELTAFAGLAVNGTVLKAAQTHGQYYSGTGTLGNRPQSVSDVWEFTGNAGDVVKLMWSDEGLFGSGLHQAFTQQRTLEVEIIRVS